MGAVGYAATYNVTLLKPTVIAGKTLQPGDYKVEVSNSTAVIRHGKNSVETKVKTESAEKKFNSTTLKYYKEGETYKLQEIGIGGSNTKLVLTESGTASGF
jgi:hypothetical protein